LITAYDLAHADQNGMAKLEQLNKDAKQRIQGGWNDCFFTRRNSCCKKQFGLTFDFYFAM
jgi:hypothetical protein